MQFSSTLACLLLSILPSLSQASPIAAVRQATPDQFLLQTQVVAGNNDCGSNKDGLYLFSYHTGAGLGVAAGEASKPTSWFYLNDTTLQWSYPNNQIGPWPVTLEYGAYTSFNQISISIAEGPATPGFFINGTGLQQNGTEQGWLACDWNLASPLIFSLNSFETYNLPSSCSHVNLIPVPYTQN